MTIWLYDWSIIIANWPSYMLPLHSFLFTQDSSYISAYITPVKDKE